MTTNIPLYHITANNTLAKCEAKQRVCPKGGTHFHDRKQGQVETERRELTFGLKSDEEILQKAAVWAKVDVSGVSDEKVSYYKQGFLKAVHYYIDNQIALPFSGLFVDRDIYQKGWNRALKLYTRPSSHITAFSGVLKKSEKPVALDPSVLKDTIITVPSKTNVYEIEIADGEVKLKPYHRGELTGLVTKSNPHKVTRKENGEIHYRLPSVIVADATGQQYYVEVTPEVLTSNCKPCVEVPVSV